MQLQSGKRIGPQAETAEKQPETVSKEHIDHITPMTTHHESRQQSNTIRNGHLPHNPGNEKLGPPPKACDAHLPKKGLAVMWE